MDKNEAISYLREFKDVNDISGSDIGYFLAGDPYCVDTCLSDQLKEALQFKHIEQDGGGEGGTEWCYTVFEVHGKLYKMNYSYYSYNGYDFDNWDEWTEVKPVEVTVIKYERI